MFNLFFHKVGIVSHFFSPEQEGKPLELKEIAEMLTVDKGGRKYLDFLDVLITARVICKQKN